MRGLTRTIWKKREAGSNPKGVAAREVGSRNWELIPYELNTGIIIPAGVRGEAFQATSSRIRSDTGEKLWFTNIKSDNSLVPAGRNVYRKKYPKNGKPHRGGMKF